MSESIQELPAFEEPSTPTKRAEGDLEVARLAAALKGDARAFSALVKPHLAMLYRLAARAGGSQSLAEDAVQESLVIVHERLSDYQAGSSLKAWLAAIVTTRARTLARSERRRALREEVSRPPEPLESPLARVQTAALVAEVQAALETLPAKRRQAAILRLDGGLSYAEIAQAMGSTEGSARVLVHLAMKTLREALAGVLSEGG